MSVLFSIIPFCYFETFFLEQKSVKLDFHIPLLLFSWNRR